MLFANCPKLDMPTIRTRFFTAFFTFVVISVASIAAFSQSSSVSAGDQKRTPTKKEMLKHEREREAARQFTLRYSPAANQRLQKGKIVQPTMQYYGVSESLSEIAKRPQPEISKEDGPLFEDHPEELFEEPMKRARKSADDPVQRVAGAELSAVVGANFTAVSAAGSAPPDTTLAVGPNHIIVWVNSRFAVYNKAGTLLSGPTAGNALFTGMGNVCATTNRGDPILQYDKLADRWILSQFAFTVNTAPPLLQCIAVSTSPDPQGTYHRYSINFDASGFNDYGKLGVMPEAYYTSYNMFTGSPLTNIGVALCASDRVKMLAGDPTATTLCGPVAFYGGGGSFLPADLDGTTPPTVTDQGGIFIRQNTAPSIIIIKLKADFAAGTATLTNGFGGAAGSTISVPIPTTLRSCSGGGGTCIAQPGTTNLLDTLGSRLMYRAAYRNRGGVESLVFAQSVDPDGTGGARGSAARWYEIRDPFAAVPTMFQVSTFDGDGTGDRWMGSIAMNKNGDMMMGYSIANVGTNLKPSIAITGRRLSDPVNTMQTETIAFTGSGSQTGTLTRWGDYTTMQVDPSDDEGFCFVGQYLPADGTFNWATRVVCAKFPSLNVTISGRVLTANGRGVRNAVVRLTNPDSSFRTVVTGPFGQFSFPNTATGATYGLSATSRRFTFGTQNVSPTGGDVTGLTIVAQ